MPLLYANMFMSPLYYHSTNNQTEKVSFQTALLRGMSPDYGLYMLDRSDIPKLPKEQIRNMRQMTYAGVAFEVLSNLLSDEIPPAKLRMLLDDAYNEDKIPTDVQRVFGKTYIMWLTKGPTYSFKDYAARFFGRALNYFLSARGLKRVVVVATSGDTGGAVADALCGLENIDNIIFYPKASISEGQRRQMTTLAGNVHAFEIDGDFDVCQALAKNLLADKQLAQEIFKDNDRFTSANSISVGRLLPQSVYPFYAYSKIEENDSGFVASVPSGNFGNMMGTVIARQMGLPVTKIICGVNENTEFPDFLQSGRYTVRPSIKSPSSAMIVSHPSNLARLVDFYGGHMYDRRDPDSGNVLQPGVIDRMPNLKDMRNDIVSFSVDNPAHYEVMKRVYEKYGIILDPHGAVGWRTLEMYAGGESEGPAVIYETADPGKFPEDVEKAIGIIPELPAGMKKQLSMPERIYRIEAKPEDSIVGLKLSSDQINEAKNRIKEIYAK